MIFTYFLFAILTIEMTLLGNDYGENEDVVNDVAFFFLRTSLDCQPLTIESAMNMNLTLWLKLKEKKLLLRGAINKNHMECLGNWKRRKDIFFFCFFNVCVYYS